MVRRQGATREHVPCDLCARRNAGAGSFSTQPYVPLFFGRSSASLDWPAPNAFGAALRSLLEIRPNFPVAISKPYVLHNTKKHLGRTLPKEQPKPYTRKNITMKRIPPVGLPRFIYTLIVCVPLVATFGVSSEIAADNNAKVTLVYEHALPNVPGKSIKGVLVEYGPGGSSPAHTHPKSAFIYATVLDGAIRSSVNDGPVVTYRTGQSFSEMPGDRHSVSENASKTEPAKLLAVFVVDTDKKELTTPYEK